MRRPLLALAAATAAALALAGCSAGTSADEPADASSGPAVEEGAYPASIPTLFGDVEIDEQPTRIVALGWGDAETVLALGGQPVGASDWLGFGGEGVGPWAEGLYDEAPTIIETLEPDYEAIAALEPDLVLDVKGSGEQDRYDRLSEIATTIGVPEGGESYLTTPEQQLEMISAALGVPQAGADLGAEIDDAFTAAADAHPDWAGLTATAATRTSEGWGAYIDGTERVEFLERLGFVLNPAIAAMEPSDGGFSVNVSQEELDTFDADLIIAFPIFIEPSEITDDPQWQAIPAVVEGHAVVIDGDVSSAYSLGSPLSQLYAIDEVTGLIADALGS